MKVCIEATPALRQQAGLGRYTAGLIAGLLHTDPQGTANGNYSIAFNQAQHMRIQHPYDKLVQYRSNLGNKPWRLRVAATYFGLPAFDRHFPNIQIYHSTGHLLPRFKTIRTVFTLHDLIPLLFPEYHLPMNRIFLKEMFPRFLRQANAVIAVSEHSKRDAIKRLGIPAEKIYVVPEGVEPSFMHVPQERIREEVRAKYRLPSRFLLSVGTIEPRKNLALLLDVILRVREKHPDVVLAIAGKDGWLVESFYAKLKALGLDDVNAADAPVRLLGRVPDEDLPILLSMTQVFLYPSLYEGFGLPPLEAMACGAPVVSSNASSLPEVVGTAGVLIDPQDTGKWVQACLGLLDQPDKRKAMHLAGIHRAQQFTWQNTANETRKIYEAVLN
ncbi:MAG TPA: glycosyltransferase family 1 protein [Anaerolineales bacterium]|nr:glycosyltransferase family 1 protein [Anaerolineales bacterium]